MSTLDLVKAIHCDLRADGLMLTFSDGKSFFYTQAFLFATRFTHAKRGVFDMGEDENVTDAKHLKAASKKPDTGPTSAP